MTDLQLASDQVNRRNPVFQAGIAVNNVIEDAAEIDRRGLAETHGAALAAHTIHAGDLNFARKNKPPSFSLDLAGHHHEQEAFVNFAGLTDTPEEIAETHQTVRCIGVARNHPKDQGKPGRERGRRYVNQHEGLVTIQCRTSEPIGPHKMLYWIADSLPSEDPKKLGRVLPRHGVYNPQTDAPSAQRFHQTISNLLTSNHTGTLGPDGMTSVSATSPYEIAFKQFQIIGYLGAVLVAQEQSGGVELTNDQMIAIASAMGLTENDARSAEVALRFNDLLFQHTNENGTSRPDSSHLLFPPRKASTVGIGADVGTDLSRLQAGVYGRLSTALVACDDRRSRIFGVSMNAAVPGGDVDVLLMVNRV